MNSTHLDLTPKHITSQIEIWTAALPIQFQHIMGIKHSGFILFLKSDFRQFLQQSVLHVFCRSGESKMPLHASADQKGQKRARVRPFWQSKTPCMPPWKERGVDGRGMVKVRKKMSWKEPLSVSLPKAPVRQQTALPSSSLPSAGRGGLTGPWAGPWAPGNPAQAQQVKNVFINNLNSCVKDQSLQKSSPTLSKLHSDKDLDHQREMIIAWRYNIYCIKRINSFAEIRSSHITCLLLSYLYQILANITSTSTKPTNARMKFYIPPFSRERNTVPACSAS